MRLGPIEVTLADQRARRPGTEERGAIGTHVIGRRLIEEDYNADLTGTALYDKFDRMRFADSQVSAALLAMKLPLLRATWSVAPVSDDKRDVEIAEFLDADLHNMTISWGDWLWHALLSLDYGSMPFFKHWEIRDGLVHLRKLAPRLPRTVLEWYVDANGGFAGLKQGVWTANGWETVEYGPEELLVVVNRREGANYRGTSVLRAAYKDWFYLDKLYRVDAIALEKRAQGVDVGTLTVDATAEDREKLEKALMTLHAHEKMFLTEVEGRWKYRVEGVSGTVLDAMPRIEHHNTRIVRSMLAEFLAMGSTASGSRAMHLDKTSLFLMALGGVGEILSDSVNRYLIPQWVNYNWAGVEVYPKLRHSRLDTRDTMALAAAVSELVKSMVITPDRGIEDEMRQAMELPPKLEGGGKEQARHFTLAKPRREFAFTDFAAVSRELDAAEERMVKAIAKVQARQVAKLVEVGGDVFRKGRRELVEAVTVPYRAEVAEAIKAELVKVHRLGAVAVRDELQKQGVAQAPSEATALAVPLNPEDEDEVLTFLGFRARAQANLLGDRLKSAFVWELLSQVRMGFFDKERLNLALAGLSDREIIKLAGNSLTEALNLGRQQEALKSKAFIRTVIYSAIMDNATCEPCAFVDGYEFEPDDPKLLQFRPPYQKCEGRGRCRCVLVYVTQAEQPASVRR